MQEEGWLTPAQAAAVLQCSRQHVVNLCRGGRIEHIDIGTKRHVYRIKRSSLEGVKPFEAARRPRARPTPPAALPYKPQVLRLA